MSNREEFSREVRIALAERAGHHCSFPGCDAMTVGPSDESETSVSKTGMACHIAAAAGGPGARRYVKDMPTEERTSIENGIWMCYKHGKLIDTDERRFTIPMLMKWREFAESRAKFRQEIGTDKPLPTDKLMKIGFAEQTLVISGLGKEVRLINYALSDSCVPVVWGGRLSNAVRDLLIELVRNTFVHANATSCIVKIAKRSIHISDNGSDFNWLRLSQQPNGRGGAAAVKELFENFGDKLLLGSKRVGHKNESIITLACSESDLSMVTPCSTQLTDEDVESIRHKELIPSWFPPETNDCKIIYLLLPPFLPHSDAALIADTVEPEIPDEKQIVFVVCDASEAVRGYLLRRFPRARVLNISQT